MVIFNTFAIFVVINEHFFCTLSSRLIWRVLISLKRLLNKFLSHNLWEYLLFVLQAPSFSETYILQYIFCYGEFMFSLRQREWSVGTVFFVKYIYSFITQKIHRNKLHNFTVLYTQINEQDTNIMWVSVTIKVAEECIIIPSLNLSGDKNLFDYYMLQIQSNTSVYSIIHFW